ncbi:MAG: HEAT repeat domain-containing protein [Planctomycetota bacterium]|nr:HEAT repeat domain-containing protein [Planctomycetota bacterium]
MDDLESVDNAEKKSLPIAKILGFGLAFLFLFFLLAWLFSVSFRVMLFRSTYAFGGDSLKSWSVSSIGEEGVLGGKILSKYLDRGDSESRIMILETLKAMKPEEAKNAAPAIAAAIVDKDPKVRKLSSEIFEKMGKDIGEATPILVQSLAADNYQRIPAILTRVGEPAVEALIEVLKDDKNPDHRLRAIQVLRSIGEDAGGAITDLGLLLTQNDDTIRFNAALALGAIGVDSIPILMTVLRDKNSGGAYTDKAILKIGRPAIPTLIKAIKEDGDRASTLLNQVFYKAVQRLKTEDPELVDLVKAAINDPRPDVREKFAFALGILAEKSDPARDALLLVLNDSEMLVKSRPSFASATWEHERTKRSPKLNASSRTLSYQGRRRKRPTRFAETEAQPSASSMRRRAKRTLGL